MAEKLSTIKKTFNEHIFDFLMLFIAISLGFFVDNYRDEYTDRKLAKSLASELIQEIQEDTLSLHNMLDYCSTRIQRMDKLFLLIDDNKTYYNDSLIYFYSAHINERLKFKRNGQTFALFTNTSYLDNFTKEVAFALTKFDISYKTTVLSLEHEREIITNKIFPFQQQVFHTELFQSIILNNKLDAKPSLRNWNKEASWIYHNYITELKIENQRVRDEYKNLLEDAKEALDVLKKEYAN